MSQKHRAVVVAVAGVAVVTAACSGSGGTVHGASSPASAVGYSACVRAHGVPKFPDPTGSEPVLKATAQELGVSSTQLQTAEQACAHLIPPTGDTAEQQQETQCATAGQCSAAVVQKWMTGLRTLAQCLRSHGEPNWPDPIISSGGRNQGLPHFPYDQAGIDHHAQPVLAKVQTCVVLTGFEGLPLP